MKFPLILLISFLFSTLSFAQITEEERSMTQGLHNALVLELPDTEKRFVQKLWKKYMSDYGARTKRVKGGTEVFSERVDIVAIAGSAGVNIYAEAAESGGDVLLTVWLDLNDERYLNSVDHGDRYVEGEKFLMRFALFVTKEQIKLELEEEQKALKTLQNELSRLKRQNEGYHRDIEMAKERIAKAEANIEQNLKDQENSTEKIEAQEETVKEVEKRLSEF